jgi:hypothetical protein
MPEVSPLDPVVVVALSDPVEPAVTELSPVSLALAPVAPVSSPQARASVERTRSARARGVS